MTEPRVTVIVTTYNRPDTLVEAVRSVIAQTVGDWKLLVVGDGCDVRTGKAVASFRDKRISYVNLSTRFGEQGGPNSVGMALADTRFSALLNHDDLFLPDHLEKGMASLMESDRDIYLGRAAVAKTSIEDGEFGKRPLFSFVTPLKRIPLYAYTRSHVLFEPVSTWIFRSSLFGTVGPWNRSSDLYRTPLQDWLLRAWRKENEFIFGKEVTVLSLLTHNQTKSVKGNYSEMSPEHRYAGHLITDFDPEEIRSRLMAGLDGSRGEFWGPKNIFRIGKNRGKRLLHRLSQNILTAWWYKKTGFDSVSALGSLVGSVKGESQKRLVRQRTGMEIPGITDQVETLRLAIEYARKNLGSQDV